MILKKIVVICAVVMSLAASSVANASLIQNGNGTFTDTSTGYEWQNISTFWGVNTNAMSGLLLPGFEFANLAQVLALEADAPAISANFFSDAYAMGVPQPTPLGRDLIWGVFGDLTEYTWKYNFDDGGLWHFSVRIPSAFADMGAFAVNTNAQTVPEPGILALLGFGLAGLATSRRKAKKSLAFR